MPLGLRLLPLLDVEIQGDGFIALSDEPWLVLDDAVVMDAADRFIEITYRAGFWDEPVRPLMRFETSDGRLLDRIAPAPVEGAGVWIGRVPRKTVRFRISPTNRAGGFSFAIESVRRRSWVGLLALGARQAPGPMRSAILTRLIGWAPESDVNLAWAIGATKLADYRPWSLERRRPIDLRGLDTPRSDWTSGPRITVGIDGTGSATALAGTLDALQAQLFQHWNALVIGQTPSVPRDDPRIVYGASTAMLFAVEGFVTSLAPGDRPRPTAFACLVEAAHRHPDHALFYGDEATETVEGRVEPVFKPGWSPRLQSQQPFLGRAVFLRGPLVGWTAAEQAAFLAQAAIPDRILAPATRASAIAINRVLIDVKAPVEGHTRRSSPAAQPEKTAAIIMPTRDQAGLLRRALTSLRRFPDSARARIILIDNDSVEAETARLFAELQGDPNLRLIRSPGAFNYSAMCNAGAAAAEADVLVFLNNDTEALHAGWLDRLIGWASCPDVGAVGGKLTYPDGRLQHVGVVVGMGESAGHFGALAAPDDLGWARRNRAVHEVSAVTGACLAVDRAKFEAVGGFDAATLPVELSDIDLCLKLAERGWVCLLDPDVHLLHAESASRGTATFRRLDVYEEQRAVFTARWRSRLRDDPYFHPGLSLYGRGAALG